MVHAARTDVIELANGDAITGEIKNLDRGILTYKTDSAGTLGVEWEDVVSITSKDSFDISTVSGGRFFGRLEKLERDAPSVRVVGAEDSADLFLQNIVNIIPIKAGFLQRIDGSLSLGYSFTRASGVGQANFGFRADYRWLGGRYALQSNSNQLSAGGGLAVATETRTGEEKSSQNLDLVLNVDYESWRFTTPKRDVSLSLFVYPSLTSWGRVRSDLDSKVRFELVTDFFLELSMYASYDNRPPETASSTIDYGWTTGLSWSF
jgi:hypothetical protein